MKKRSKMPGGAVRQQGRKAMRRQRPMPALPNLTSADLHRGTKWSHAVHKDARGLPACSRAMWLRVMEATASLSTEMASQSPMSGQM